MPKRGVAVVTYDRVGTVDLVLQGVYNTVPKGTKVVLCDDGSAEIGSLVHQHREDYRKDLLLIQGRNLGAGANKNRALWALQDCDFLAILEDDLIPTRSGWFELYENATAFSGIHHFCRVQDKEVEETIPEFTKFMATKSMTPIYGPSPRGDFTFFSRLVLDRVGAFNPLFKGCGYAHGEWSERVVKAGLIPHPLKWVDIKEARDSFEQKGDTEGGRWNLEETTLKKQLDKNKRVRDWLKKRKPNYIHQPLMLP